MMNKYIKITMTPTKYDIGGSFLATADFKLDNMEMPFYNISVKIDTGCSISTIPAKRLKISQSHRKQLKAMDIKNQINWYLSYGVETGGEKHKEPQTFDEKIECSALKFEHNISEFGIDGVPINVRSICINYDRSSNILIGMDILKDWDIHIGTIDNPDLPEHEQTIFLGCPRDQINEEYLLELERLFKLGTTIS